MYVCTSPMINLFLVKTKAETAALLCPINEKMGDRTLKPFIKLDQDQSGWDNIKPGPCSA